MSSVTLVVRVRRRRVGGSELVYSIGANAMNVVLVSKSKGNFSCSFTSLCLRPKQNSLIGSCFRVGLTPFTN